MRKRINKKLITDCDLNRREAEVNKEEKIPAKKEDEPIAKAEDFLDVAKK